MSDLFAWAQHAAQPVHGPQPKQSQFRGVTSEQLAAMAIVSDRYGTDVGETPDRAPIVEASLWSLLRPLEEPGLVELDQSDPPLVYFQRKTVTAIGWARLTDRGRRVLAGEDTGSADGTNSLF